MWLNPLSKSPGSKGPSTSSYRTVGKTYDGVKVLAPKAGSRTFTAAQVRQAVKKALDEVSTGGKARPSQDPEALRVKKRDDGRFEVKRPGAKRVSAVTETQAEAIARARQLEPGKSPIAKRVRKQPGARKGTWREA